MTTLQPTPPEDTIHFPSLASLRAAHTELLKDFRANGSTAEMIAKVEFFIRRGRATGALLDAEADRWAAQSELDYWATQLYKPDYEPPDATLDEFDPQVAPALDDSLCPYMGLDAFHERNESVFFGRERLVSELISKLKTTRFLVVLGSSGSGKSSVVRAGLIPELKNGALPGSSDWKYFPPMVPGSNPLLNLARLMLPSDKNSVEAETEVDSYRENPGYLAQIASERFGNHVVLVVDQFEEIFTLSADEISQHRFVDNLIGLCQAPNADHRVIITMRSDFEMNVVRLPYLQTMFEQDAVRITPLTASELRATIEAPAARIGLKFEEGVVNALLNDTLGEPAALPLLQFTLLKLWEKRERNRVTWEAYKKLGGGRQALARSADEFYNQLIPEEQVTMRRILLKMVRPGEGLEVTSNRIPTVFLYQNAEANDRIERVLNRLIQAHLVRVSEGDMAIDDQVEIAHEALVRNWPRLVEWLEEERVALRQRQRLTTAAEEWQRLNKASSALWRRELLEEARRYDDLNELERQFVNASGSRQRRVRIAGTTGAIVIMTYLVISVIIAQQNAVKARQQAKLALASGLASQAQLIVETQKSKQTVGMLLAAQSMRLFPSVDAARVLQNNPLPVPVARLDYDAGVNSLAFSPDGQYVVSGSDDKTARVLEVTTGKEIARMTHGDIVNSVAFSPDGEYVVSGSGDGTARVWEAATGKEIARMTHDDWVRSVAFSPDGQYVVSGSDDKTARVWEAMTGKEIARMTHDDWVNSVVFSPDGQYVASGSDDGTARVWEAKSGKEIARMTHSDWVRSVAFSPDGQYVVSGSDDKTARVWEARTGKEIAHMAHDDWVNSVAFSPDGQYVASAGYDLSVRIWTATTGKEIARVSHDSPVWAIGFSQNGQQIVSGSDDGTALISDALTGKTIASMSYNGEVRSIAFSPDGQLVASGICEVMVNDERYRADFCYQGTVQIWKAAPSNETVSLNHSDTVKAVAFSPDGRYLASGGRDSTAHVWEVTTGKEISHMIHDDWVNSVAFSPDGRYVVSGSGDGTARVWEAATGKEIARMTHDDWVGTVAFSPDGQYVVSGGGDGTARVWEAATGKEIARITHKGGAVESVAFSPTGQYLASVGCEEYTQVTKSETVCTKGNLDLLEVSTGKQVFYKDQSDRINSIAFSPDGRYMVSGSDDSTARVWDTAAGKEIARMSHDRAVISVAFSPDGQFVASGANDDTVRVWEARTGKEIIRMIHDNGVRSVAFSPDGQYVISGSSDNTASVWEVKTGDEIARMTHEDWVNAVAFSPDGRYAASGGVDKTVRIWNWRTVDIIASVCARLSRNFTSAEWKRYFGDEPYQLTCTNLPVHPTVMVDTLLPTLLDANDKNRTQKAIAIAKDLLKANSLSEISQEQAIKLINSIILDRIYGFDADRTGGIIKPSIVLLDDAKMNGLKIEDDYILNNICWDGSTYGYAKDVLQYCEQAVELLPDSANRDSRGLARALTGDYAGAIEDFQFFVDANDYNDDYVQQRKQWITDLKAGKNPFTTEVLQMLRNE